MAMLFNEQRFYEALENIFTGTKIEGQGGFVNLLKIKSAYYRKVLAVFQQEVAANPVVNDLQSPFFKEEFFGKLYTFFEKYFSESGSVYFVQTAAWQRVYEKVYTDNKDVVLFWKTHMLYYVKTDVLYHSTFISVPVTQDTEHRFYFDCVHLTNKEHNAKKDLLFSFKELREGDLFVLEVNYSSGGKKTKIADIVKDCNLAIRNRTRKDWMTDEEVVSKAIKSFEKQTAVDFFINKDAEKFLTEQLELYLHQVLLEEANVWEQKRLEQLKTIKEFALKIIVFISQFENELVRIWNKPKFVLRSNYVITLNKLPPDLTDKLAKHKGMKAQIAEWIELGMVEKGFKFTNQSKNSRLPIDTKYFKDLEIAILSLFDDLDDALDGRLIHSENYQALNTLQQRYRNKIQCVYIDPPFNTGNDFIFLDKFQDSTWNTIIQDRLCLTKPLLSESGGLYLHLDHLAEHYGRILLDTVFGVENFRAKITWNTGDNISGFKSKALNWIRQADFIHFYTKSDKYSFTKIYEPTQDTAKDSSLGWLDILKHNESLYIEKWLDGKFIRVPYSQKVKAKGTIWNDIYSFMYSETRITEALSFTSNQKPENLLRRIIQSITQPGDTCLDYFVGSGTTCAVAHKLNRKWIAVEAGEWFREVYLDIHEISKRKHDTEHEEEIDIQENSAVVEIIEETDAKYVVLMKKIGILGRMKIVLKGDKNFTAIHTAFPRKPHLSKDINWEGGGFFKYFDLEQYEDTLLHCAYSEDVPSEFWEGTERTFDRYIFQTDAKLAEVLEINGVHIDVNFNKFYQDIDFAETISLLTGLSIKRIGKDSVILSDGKEYKTNPQAMSEADKFQFAMLLKPLLWWGE